MISLVLIWIIASVWVMILWRKNPQELSLKQKRYQILMLVLPVLFLGNYLTINYFKNTSELNRFLYLVLFCMIITPINYFLVKILHQITLKIKK